MKDGKPDVVSYMWEHRGRHACVDRAYAEQLIDDGQHVAPLIRLSDHEAVVAEIRSELERTKAREADTDKQLLALRRAIAKTPTDTGDEKHQDALAEWEIILERIAERYEFRDAPQR